MTNPTSSSIRDVILKQIKREAQKQDKAQVTPAITMGIDNPNDCYVNGRPGYIWVSEYGMPGAIFQAFNQTVKRLVNLPVLITKENYEPYRRVVVGVDWDNLPNSTYLGQTYELIQHSESHEWQDTLPGLDAISVYPRALAAFRVYPEGSYSIGCARGYYIIDGVINYYVGESGYNLVGDLPATGYNVGILIYFDFTTGAIAKIVGTPVALPNPPTYPTVPDDVFPLELIRMYDTMSSITENDFTIDLRTPFIFSTGGGGGGGHVIMVNGTPFTQRSNLDIVGTGITGSDDAGNDKTIINFPVPILWSDVMRIVAQTSDEIDAELTRHVVEG